MISIDQALIALSQGGIIVYPTDTVYGIGCLPSQETTLQMLLAFKKRSRQFIVIIDQWERYQHWIDIELKTDELKRNKPTTWILPATNIVPNILLNHQNEIAIRQVTHEPTCSLLRRLQEPLVSTSANYPGEQTAKSPEEAGLLGFPVMEGENGFNPPSQIIHYASGRIIRS